MFKLLRRISGSFTGRLDRTWNDDATTNTVQIGRKRRMSDDDDTPAGSLSKRVRPHGEPIAEEAEAEGDVDAEGESVSASSSSHRGSSPITESAECQVKETPDVREVRKGVKEVDIEDKEENRVQESTPRDAENKKDEPPTSASETLSEPKAIDELDDTAPPSESKASSSRGDVEKSTEDMPASQNIDPETATTTQPPEEPLPSNEDTLAASKEDVTADSATPKEETAVDKKLDELPASNNQSEDLSVVKQD